ncbi:hypothetical protein LSH36_74g07006 [Paralvinella palmiformis]|uniref:Uncharacterized protein n=1 Tax=Paralvinella palmiformis TaxID=53620 RepID=A0AAD9K2X8_9ANNE|nr:hypothetical protein LSH36_74g07006 [Paralvinella palmiformis]
MIICSMTKASIERENTYVSVVSTATPEKTCWRLTSQNGLGLRNTTVRMEMPEEGKNKLAFQNHHKQFPALMSSTQIFMSTTKEEGHDLDPRKSYTWNTQEHEACSYCKSACGV